MQLWQSSHLPSSTAPCALLLLTPPPQTQDPHLGQQESVKAGVAGGQAVRVRASTLRGRVVKHEKTYEQEAVSVQRLKRRRFVRVREKEACESLLHTPASPSMQTPGHCALQRPFTWAPHLDDAPQAAQPPNGRAVRAGEELEELFFVL